MTESGVWRRLGATVKNLGKRRVPFAEISTGGYPGTPFGSFGGGWGSKTPGATYDYATAAGELWENRVVAACVNAVSQALSDAPPYLEKRDGAAWVRVETHPVIELLNAPNGYYGSPHLWSATAASECTAGQAFWRIEKSRAGLPAELWWEDARRFRALGDAEHFIKGYRFQTERGGWVDLANDDVIHFRHALNPYNPREGRTPLSTGLRQVALDNGIASYSGSILRNSGVMSLLISTKDASAGAQVTAGQVQDFVDKLKQRLFGDGAGGIAGLNVPLDVQKMSFSPDEMAVDKLTNYAEASICALLGVDPMVCGLGSGTLQKTYANMAEALNDFWERRIIPTKNRHSAELGAQLLPLYGLDARDYRIAWDYSKVAALQENEDQAHARVRADYQAGLIDLYAAQTAIGLASDDGRREVYVDRSTNSPTAVKGTWVEADHPRGQPENRGQFVEVAKGFRVRAKKLSPRAQRALESHRPATKAMQRYAEEYNEQRLATVITGGKSHIGNQPVDVTIHSPAGNLLGGIELKTMIFNKRRRITMRGGARARKEAWERRNGVPIHTVVFDDIHVYNALGTGKHDESKRIMFYRRGFGNFSITAMYQVKDMAELNMLVRAPNDELPGNARRRP